MKLGYTSDTSSRMYIELGNGLPLENPVVNSKLNMRIYIVEHVRNG